MYNSKYISIKEVTNNIKRGRLFKDLPFEAVIDYTVDVMRLIVNEKYMVTLPALIDVKQYKGPLPCGFEYMVQCTKFDGKSFYPMHTSTDNFSTVYNNTLKPSVGTSYTYTLNNNVIFTDFEEGQLFIVYKSIPLDAEEYPMIPDNVNVKLAVENYIKFRHLENMASDEKVVERALQRAEQEYLWYVGKSRAAATNMTLDEMETFANSMSQLFVDPSQFKDRLQFLSNQEFLRIK